MAAESDMRSRLVRPALSLCRRELVRFIRQPNRVIGALATPILFWLLMGLGMGHSFSAGAGPDGGDYMLYFFPGTLVMILLFTAVFSTISIIEDRNEGFLQSVLVSPVSGMAVVLGKLSGGAILAFGQGLLFLLLAPLIGVRLGVLPFLSVCAFMLIIGFALTGLGFCIAWRMSSTQGFHAILNLLLMPMWLLSGAIFPARGAMRWVIAANPLSYGLAGMRRSLYLDAHVADLPPMAACAIVTVIFAAVMFALATMVAQGRVKADLQ